MADSAMVTRYAGPMDAANGHDRRLALLEGAAARAGGLFGLEVLQVTRLPSLTRAVFALDCVAGRHVLRMHAADERSDRLESLLRWLQALAMTGLCVPRPLTIEDGHMLAEIDVAGLPGLQRCSLLTWLPGESLKPEQITPGHARAMGELLARLHDYAAGWQPPAGFARPRLDAEGLFGHCSPYASDSAAELFGAELCRIMVAVEERTRALMQRLDAEAGAFGLIHADLIAKNCLFVGHGVCALDFDHCAWGYYLYDLAPAMLQFSALPAREALAPALWTGYTTRRPMPSQWRDDLETLVAARLVASCRWLAANQGVPTVRAQMQQLLAQRTATLRDYLATGRLRRRSTML